MQELERIARESYGRLRALVAAKTRDLSLAEDVLGDALMAALVQWPKDGLPKRPEAWLITVARRRAIESQRRGTVHARAVQALALLAEEAEAEVSASVFPDRRLELMFVCAHPSIDEGARTALMLQTVLGMNAAQVGAALRVPAKTMGQRLWRAKRKIDLAGIRFEVPEAESLSERLKYVLEAIYAAFGEAWQDTTHRSCHGLAEEAIWLARLASRLLPEEPEALGLLALLLFIESRRETRRAHGRYVPLSEQAANRWNVEMIAEAERCLQEASSARRIGPFQLEAAIQSAYVAKFRHGVDSGEEIVRLHEALVRLAPTLSAWVGFAAALLDHQDEEAALTVLDAMDQAAVRDYQPYWAVRAHVLAALGSSEAEAAFRRAAGLTEDPATRAYLLSRLTSKKKRTLM
ncbi:MAG: DUF6596 domain-containing protein [Myxococcota bacterium]